MRSVPTPESAADREELKSIAVRLLLCALLAIVVPATALLAAAVAPDEWLAFQTIARLVALAGGVAGVGATILTFLAARAHGPRLYRALSGDDRSRWVR